MPVAQNQIRFALAGPARIIGVGNGNPTCLEPDVFIDPHATWSRSLFNGFAQVIVQSTRDAGEFELTVSADGLTSASTTVKTASPTPPSTP